MPTERVMRVAILTVIVALAVVQPVAAQDPAPPPPTWTTSAGAGLALTSGNSDTSTFNANYSVVYDPRRRNIVKSEGLVIRGEDDGELSTDRLSLNVRDEYRLNGHAFVFGQTQYLRDTFKEIDYLVAPTGGIGYKFLDTDDTKLSVDAGLGAVWEKNLDVDVRQSGAVTVDQRFSQRLTANTTLTQSFAGLWKTDDFADTLYQVGAGIAVAMSTHTQIKIEWLDTYKNQPPSAEIEKNDTSVIIALVFKN